MLYTVWAQACGRAEPDAALWMAEKIPGMQRMSLGVDKGYDQAEVAEKFAQEEGHAARSPETAECCGPTTRQRGLSDQPAGAQTDGRDFWLYENDWIVAEAMASRPGPGRPDVHLCGGCLQPGTDEESECAHVTDIGKRVS